MEAYHETSIPEHRPSQAPKPAYLTDFRRETAEAPVNEPPNGASESEPRAKVVSIMSCPAQPGGRRNARSASGPDQGGLAQAHHDPHDSHTIIREVVLDDPETMAADVKQRDEVSFDSDAHLLLPSRARSLKASPDTSMPEPDGPESIPVFPSATMRGSGPAPTTETTHPLGTMTTKIAGRIPPETWNRFGTTLLPKLRGETSLKLGVECKVTVDGGALGQALLDDTRQILDDLNLTDSVGIETELHSDDE